MRMRFVTNLIAVATILLLLPMSPRALADDFDLKGGGRLKGELLNADSDQPSALEIRTARGGKIVLAADEVLNAELLSPTERRYNELLPQMPNSVEGMWKMAEWCRENRLTEQRQFHLEQILERDSDHKGARAGLGYTTVGGKWVITDEWNREQGFVRDGVHWKTRQELSLETHADRFEDREIEWKKNVSRWIGQLNGRRGVDALKELRAVDDPAAATAFVDAMDDEPNRDLRLLCIEALGKMTASSVATTELAKRATTDLDERVRDAAIDKLVENNVRAAVTTFIRALKDDDPLLINRAAIALSRMGDKRAIVPLIEALITEHKKVIKSGGNGQLGASFGGPGGGGLSAGGSTKVLKGKRQNPAVYQALVALTGANFLYDQIAWRNWYAQQHTPELVNLRRD